MRRLIVELFARSLLGEGKGGEAVGWNRTSYDVFHYHPIDKIF